MTESGGTPRKLTRAQEREFASVNAQAFAALRARRLAFVTQLRSAGWPLAAIGKLLGVSKQRIDELLRKR